MSNLEPDYPLAYGIGQRSPPQQESRRKNIGCGKGEKGRGELFNQGLVGGGRPKEAYLAMESVSLGGARKGGRQINDLLLVLESLAQNGGILDTKCVELTAV